MAQRRGTRIQGLIGVLTAGLVMTACAAGKNASPPNWSASGTVAQHCEALVEHLEYARKSTAGPVVGAVVLVPVGLGLGAMFAALGRPDALVILPAMAIDGAVGAVQRSRQEFADIRNACLTAGGPEHVGVARSIGFLALRRHRDGKPKDAVRLYRDGLALVEHVGDEEVEGALRFRIDAASLMAAYPSSRDEAVAIYAPTIAALESRLGPEHPDLLGALEPYARLLRTLGRDEDAERLEARTVAIRTAMTAASASAAGPESPCDDSPAEPCSR